MFLSVNYFSSSDAETCFQLHAIVKNLANSKGCHCTYPFGIQLFGVIKTQYFCVFHQISDYCCCSEWNRS